MMTSKTAFTLALTAALGAAGVAQAGENPFQAQMLDQGYQVAEAGMKAPDGKCGGNKETAKSAEGNCGAKAAEPTKAKDGKCGEGKCGANKRKISEGSQE